MEQFQHYISKNIRTFYKRRILFPILYLLLLLITGLIYPVKNMILPTQADPDCDVARLYDDRNPYVSLTLEDLYFTGYTKEWLFGTSGYYYYTMMGENCVIVLLTPSTCQQGLPVVESVRVRARVLYNSRAMDRLLDLLSEDLSWSKSGITDAVSSYMLSEPDATDGRTLLFALVYVLTGLYALASVLIYLVYILFPVYSRPCQRLRYYGRPRDILAEAEEELATLPQLATEDMFITEHYFIETSRYGVAIVPIREILWIYKYSTLHKFLWHHFSISYTLHITATKHLYIRCPKNIKSDIDGIMDYLAEANHNILVGFSEENRLKTEEIQGDLEIFKRFLTFLSKRV
jgi:hypothetical protein